MGGEKVITKSIENSNVVQMETRVEDCLQNPKGKLFPILNSQLWYQSRIKCKDILNTLVTEEAGGGRGRGVQCGGGENWDNYNRTTIRKKKENARRSLLKVYTHLINTLYT